MLSDKSFENLSDPISGIAEVFTLRVLRMIVRIARKLTGDPGAIIDTNDIMRDVKREHAEFVRQTHEWVDDALPVAYIRGIKETDRQINRLNIDAVPADRITLQMLTGGGDISGKARRLLSEFPQHHTMYAVFQDAAYNALSDTRLPVVRDVRGKIRQLIIEASEAQYRDADTFTRRQMSQDIVRRFADDGITGITYSNGRRVKLDSYAEMVARSQTGNAARQASMGRQQQYGFDLVRISVHYPTSDLCAPYQGKIYSISGNHDYYPPLESTNPGSELFHGNCKHFQSPYFPGLSPELEPRQTELGRRENREKFELTQQQRNNERMIKKYKRREAVAMTDAEAKRAKAKVREWQAKNRKLVDDNTHLRRQYHREQI